jgi:nucleoside-diphosphate-sugar epimerase
MIQDKKRHIVLGGAGFIGFHLVKQLSKNGLKIIVVDNLLRGKQDNLFDKLIEESNIEFIYGDVTSYNFMHKLIEEGDTVYNLVAYNGTINFYSEPVAVLKNTAISSIVAAEVAAKKKAFKYIYFGSSESYAGGYSLNMVPIPTPESVPLILSDLNNPRWSYAAGKSIGEIACHANYSQYGLNFTIFRVHNIYGPRMGFGHVIPDLIDKFTNRNGLVTGLSETRSFMFVEDTVKIVIAIANDSNSVGQTINIGSNEEITIRELAEKLLKKMNLSISIIDGGNLDGSVKRRKPDIKIMQSFGDWKLISLDDGLTKMLSEAVSY